jgi:7-cyano-7-deazaguanine synthase
VNRREVDEPRETAMQRTEQTAIALLSGGLDSGVALGLWLRQGGVAHRCLFCDYGQLAAAREAAASEALASRWRLPWQRVDLPWLAGFARASGSALVDDRRELPLGTLVHPGDDRSAAAVWVPARNAVLVAIAAACAEANGAGVVITGFNREEAATFADNSAEFVAAADRFLALGTLTKVRVASPTLQFDKRQIVGAARSLGLAAADFWSCYRGAAVPCGSCESCLRSQRAWIDP